MIAVQTFTGTIYVGGSAEEALRICRAYCDEIGLCVTVTPTTYVYTDGQEAGVAVGLINYPRFPARPQEIREKAADLAELLRVGLGQRSFSIVFPDETVWLSTGTAPTGAPSSISDPASKEGKAMSANEEKGGAPRRSPLTILLAAARRYYDTQDHDSFMSLGMAARRWAAEGTAAPAALSPSSSTPPAPDLPQEKEDLGVPSARPPADTDGDAPDEAELLRQVRDLAEWARDEHGINVSALLAQVKAAEHRDKRRKMVPTLIPTDAVPAMIRTAAQRPPDPAAPDLRDRLRRLADEWDAHSEAVWDEQPHTAQDYARCAKQLRAALDEKQVGAAPHSPEER